MTVYGLCDVFFLYKKYSLFSSVIVSHLGTVEARLSFIGITVLFMLCVPIIVLLCAEKGKRFLLLLPYYCIPVAVVSLLVVNPIGPRCFFVSYLMTMVFTVSLFDYVVGGIKAFNYKKPVACFLAVAVMQAVVFTSFFCAYIPL